MHAPRLVFLLALSCALPAQAQIYKWVDASGQTHFSTQPPSSAPIPPPQMTSSPASTANPDSDATPPLGEEEITRQEGKMCRQAVQLTHEEDIPKLRSIDDERLKAGLIDHEQHRQAMRDLEQAKTHVTLPNCLLSKGEDREEFKCLSKGLGLAICSGAAGEAVKAAMLEERAKR